MGQINFPGGQANNTGMPPDQMSKQSWVTDLSLYKHWPLLPSLRNEGLILLKVLLG